jgi:hypothetical protein
MPRLVSTRVRLVACALCIGACSDGSVLSRGGLGSVPFGSATEVGELRAHAAELLKKMGLEGGGWVCQ